MIALRASDDRALAERCVAGDPGAQRELFERYKRHVHGTLYRILGTNGEMDDLVQESFLSAFRSLHGFRGESSLSTWLDRITARVAYAHLSRARQSTARLELLPEIASDDPSAEDRALTREAGRRLYAVLDRIEARQRIAFTLHVIDGRSLQEVATITESSVMVTKTRVWRASREVESRARRDPLLASLVRTDTASKKKKG